MRICYICDQYYTDLLDECPRCYERQEQREKQEQQELEERREQEEQQEPNVYDYIDVEDPVLRISSIHPNMYRVIVTSNIIPVRWEYYYYTRRLADMQVEKWKGDPLSSVTSDEVKTKDLDIYTIRNGERGISVRLDE